MKEKINDRGLLIVAKANIKAAKRDLEESDEVFVNFALFNVSQAVEKTLKFLCSCNGIDYDYSHFLASIADKLLVKNVKIPQLIQDSLKEYGEWATRSRYTANQMAQRSYVKKHIECVEEWINIISKQMSFF